MAVLAAFAELLFQLADYLIKSSLGERIIRLSGQAARYSETPFYSCRLHLGTSSMAALRTT
jgi:hypothetical protein